jgi:hypothetical protein
MQPNNIQPQQPSVIEPQNGQAQYAAAPTVDPQGAPLPTVGILAANPKVSFSLRRKLLQGLIALVVIVALVGIVYGGNSYASASAVKSAATEYITALNQGDTTKAYNLSSQTIRSQQTQAQFAQTLGGLTADSPKLNGATVKTGVTTATYSVDVDGLQPTSTNRTDGFFLLQLSRTGVNTWQVDSVTVQ